MYASVGGHYVTTICSPRTTPPWRKLVESGSCCKAASMAWSCMVLPGTCRTTVSTAPRMGLLDIGHEECDVVTVAAINVPHAPHLGPERRSGVAAKDQGHRPLSPKTGKADP